MAHPIISGKSDPRPAGIEEQLAREARELARKRDDPASPYFRGHQPERADRRRFVLRSMGALGAAGGWMQGALAQAPLGAVVHDVPDDPSKVQGYPLADESYAKLLAQLSDRKFQQTSPELRANILSFYSDLAAPIETRKDAARWQAVVTSLSQLQSITLPPSIAAGSAAAE